MFKLPVNIFAHETFGKAVKYLKVKFIVSEVGGKKSSIEQFLGVEGEAKPFAEGPGIGVFEIDAYQNKLGLRLVGMETAAAK